MKIFSTTDIYEGYIQPNTALLCEFLLQPLCNIQANPTHGCREKTLSPTGFLCAFLTFCIDCHPILMCSGKCGKFSDWLASHSNGPHHKPRQDRHLPPPLSENCRFLFRSLKLSPCWRMQNLPLNT